MCGALIVLFFSTPLSAQPAAGDDAQVAPAERPWRVRNQGERFFVEAGFTLHRVIDDRYIEILRTPFGFEDDVSYHDAAGVLAEVKPMVRIGSVVHEHFAWHLGYRMLDARTLTDANADQLRYHNHGFDLGGRLRFPFAYQLFAVSVLAGVGPSFGFTDYLGDRSVHLGYLVHLTLHTEFNLRALGLFLEAGYVHAPTIRNAIGYVHNAGGLFMTLGVRFREREEGYP